MMFSKAIVTQGSSDRQFLLQWGQVLIGSLFIGLLAQIQVPLLFTPVPLTLQTFAVLVLARTLGKVKATLAILTYLGQILLGLPVLAGMISKPLALMGANAGYLIGFIPLAYFAGWVFERQFKLAITCIALAIISLLQLLMGALWLGLFVGMQNAIWMGVLPFIFGEMLKIFAVTAFFNRSTTDILLD